MNDYPHRNTQNLAQIGPVYSTLDEKQRAISEQILNHKIRPELKIKINMNIIGLDRKKEITPKNPETFRWTKKWSTVGKSGFRYAYTMNNINRLGPPLFGVILFYYVIMDKAAMVYYAKECLNQESEGAYMKLNTFPGHYPDKISLMA
jgi:hypothetical protein